MFCEKCCKEIPENAKFCPFCGTKQTGNHTQLLPDNMPKESSSPPSNMQKESTPPQTDIESAKIWGGIIFFSIIAIIAIVIFTKQTSIVNSTPVKTANTMAKAPVTPAPPTKVKVPIPASFQAVSVDENIIGEPTVSVSLKNNSDKLIDAFKIAVSAKNNYNDNLKDFDGSILYFRGLSQNEISPGATSPQNHYWTLHQFETGTKFTIQLMSVHFFDGSEWKSDQSDPEKIEVKKSNKVIE